LNAIDVIWKNLESEKENQNEIDKTINRLQAIPQLKSETKIQKKISPKKLKYPITGKERELLKSAKEKNYNIYQIEKLILSNISIDSFNKLPIYSDIMKVGFHITTFPQYDNINRQSKEDVLRILFATKKTKEELYYTIFDPIKPAVLAHWMDSKALKILIIDSVPGAQKNENKILSEYGTCDIARNGIEALARFKHVLSEDLGYDLIILEIELSDGDGFSVLNKIRNIEAEHAIYGRRGVKIIMSSQAKDKKIIMKAFREQSDAYIIKPITTEKIAQELKKLGLI
jgi:two-component system chemotaxis response regulator CheY